MEIQNYTYRTKRYRPKRLSAFIKYFTYYQFTDVKPVKLIPEGCFELIFQLDSQFSQRPVDANNWQYRPEFFIGGLHNKSYLIKPERNFSSLISVIFKPNCARYFIPDKLQFYKNRIVGLEDIFRQSKISQFVDMKSSISIQEKIDLIEVFLASLLKEHPVSRVDHALDIIIHRNGFISISELASVACLSQSHMRKQFNEAVGMSPKEYSKILRINFIAKHLENNPESNLTRLSYDLGYFDQSHFIKDFKSVTGSSPKKYC